MESFVRLEEDAMEEGQLKAVVDSSGPFSLSTEGAIAAFDLLRSRHAKGKVVVAVSSSG